MKIIQLFSYMWCRAIINPETAPDRLVTDGSVGRECVT